MKVPKTQMQKEDGAGRPIKGMASLKRVHDWALRNQNKKTPKDEFKTYFPQHLSLGTHEQRRFQDPDAGG
jgi:hypothetical protein